MNGLLSNVERIITEHQPLVIAGFAVAIVAAAVGGQLLGRLKTHPHGNAAFADASEVEAANLYGDEGMVLGVYRPHWLSRPRVLRLAADSHMALVSPTRGGKDVAIVIPSISTWIGSALINDKKEELGDLLSEGCRRRGNLVFFWKPYSITTHQYNPLDYVDMDPMEFVASIQSIAFILYPPQKLNETMWSNNARALFVYLVMLVKESDDMPSTLGEIYRITGGYGMPVPDYLQKIIWKRNYDRVEHLDEETGEVAAVEYVKKAPYDGTGVPHLSDTCVNGLLSYVTAPKDTGGGILSNTRAALQIWASEVVDAATSRSDFDLRTLRKVPQSIFVTITPAKTEQGTVLLEMFYKQAITLNMDKKTGIENPLKVLLGLDEFGNLNLPIIPATIGEMAGYGLFCLLVLQSKGQLVKWYGIDGAENLLDNCSAAAYFTPELKDSKEISEMIGTRTIKVKSRQLGKPMQGSVSEQGVPVVLPQVLREMPRTKQIIKVKYCRHIYCDKIIWYKRMSFLKHIVWKISPMLNGIKSPTLLQLEEAVGELRAFIPTLDTEAWLEAKRVRAVSMATEEAPEMEIVNATHLDIVGGLKLNEVVVGDMEFEEGTSTQDQIKGYLDAFFEPESDDSDDDETIDYETGEVLTRTVNITGILDVA